MSDVAKVQRSNVQWINELDQRVLPPRSARKQAVYRSFEEGGIDPLVREAQYANILPPSTVLEGTYSFLDPFREQMGSVLAKNVARIESAPEIIGGRHTGGSIVKELIDPIIFDAGYLYVNIETEYPLYVFLELHPLNKSNRYRDPARAASAFYRYDIRNMKGKGTELAEADLGLDAELLVKDWDFKKVLEYASSIPENKIPVEGRQPGDVKLDLRRFARNNPKPFFSLIRNTSAVNQFIVQEALDMGFVVYDRDLKFFHFFGEKTPLFEAGKVDGNPVTKFLEFINDKKGAEVKTAIEEKINYWEPVK